MVVGRFSGRVEAECSGPLRSGEREPAIDQVEEHDIPRGEVRELDPEVDVPLGGAGHVADVAEELDGLVDAGEFELHLHLAGERIEVERLEGFDGSARLADVDEAVFLLFYFCAEAISGRPFDGVSGLSVLFHSALLCARPLPVRDITRCP